MVNPDDLPAKSGCFGSINLDEEDSDDESYRGEEASDVDDESDEESSGADDEMEDDNDDDVDEMDDDSEPSIRVYPGMVYERPDDVEDDDDEPEVHDCADIYTGEEYKIWKKNVPYLYDLMLTSAFDWPTLTFEWSPEVLRPANRDHIIVKMLVGTNTSDTAQNYLRIFQANLPSYQLEKVCWIFLRFC